MKEPNIAKTQHGLVITLDHDWLQANNFSCTNIPNGMGYDFHYDINNKHDLWPMEKDEMYLRRICKKSE